MSKQLLLERYVNLFGKDQIAPYIDDIWNILQKSYAPIGGFRTAASKEDLLNKVDFAKLARKNGKIVAAAVYKDKHGRKTVGIGFDGTEEGKAAVLRTYLEDVKQKRAWGEFSGKAEGVMLKYGGIPIPNKYAAQILGKPIKELNPDGYHYTREIGGENHEKIIIGHLNLDLPVKEVLKVK